MTAILFGALEIGQAVVSAATPEGIDYGFPVLGGVLLISGLGMLALREWARVLMILGCTYAAFTTVQDFSAEPLPEMILPASVLMVGLGVIVLYLASPKVKVKFYKTRVWSKWLKTRKKRRRREKDEAEIDWFRRKVLEGEEHLFGMSLFFRCLSLTSRSQRQRFAMTTGQYEGIVQRGREALTKTRQLLDELQDNPHDPGLLRQLGLALAPGDTVSDEMQGQARTLVKTYYRLFPGRPKEEPLTDEEVLRLAEAALGKPK